MNMMRPLLIGALLGVAFLLWNAWQREYAHINQPTIENTKSAEQGNDVVNIPRPMGTQTPSSNVPTVTTTKTSELVEVKTDVLHVKIDTLGGNVVYASLPRYAAEQDSDKPFVLLNNEGYEYVAQSGLTGASGPDTDDGQVVYQAKQSLYTLTENEDKIVVDLSWKNNNGLTITKLLTFHRGNYAIEVDYVINNQSNTPWEGYLYNQLKQSQVPSPKRGLFNIATFTGATISTPDKKYEKFSYANLQKRNLQQTATGGWLAFQQHYFITAWAPNQETQNLYYSQTPNANTYIMGVVSPEVKVMPGNEQVLTSQLFVGPKLADQLERVAPNLDLAVDYGWLWFISVILFWLLQKIHLFVNNWGWSIVILTILIKLVFFHLSATSYRSMAKLRHVQPRLLEMRERYKGDRQRMSQAMMEFYKKEKINPLGGCLPILVQIPVFIALYWVLLESVQLRHAPFILWIHDLSKADPYFVLPILMGISMFIQQKLNPTPPDPMQAKIMQFLPVVFTVLFLTFPAGLVLYWLVNNIISIAQQWWITRSIAKHK